MSTQEFRIRPDGFKEIRKTLLTKSLPLLLLTVLGGLAIIHFTTNEQQKDLSTYQFLIPVISGLLVLSTYLAIKRQQQLFESYRLTLDDNNITREQYNTPTISIPIAEIREIIKNSNGSIIIKGNSTINSIGVPSQISDPEKLESLLNQLKPISNKTKEPFFQKFSGLFSVLLLGLMGAVFLSSNKIVVGICGPVLLIVLGYSIFETQRSKNIDNKTKKGMWWLLVIIISIITTMYLKLIR